VTCMHDRHKTTKVCACVRVCVFKGFGVLSPGFGCAVVAAVWRDLHARQAQEYLLCVCVCVCVCVFKGFGVLSPGFGCAVVAAVWRDLHARQAQEYL